jgi:hypothetical protein
VQWHTNLKPYILVRIITATIILFVREIYSYLTIYCTVSHVVLETALILKPYVLFTYSMMDKIQTCSNYKYCTLIF